MLMCVLRSLDGDIYLVDILRRFALDIWSLRMCSVYGDLGICNFMIPRYRTYRKRYEFRHYSL
jgi:hypothetical protein